MFGNVTVPRLASGGAGLALSFLLLSGCGENATTEPHGPDRAALSTSGAAGQLEPEVRSALVELKRATADYHAIEKAEEDGWTVRFPEPCLAHADEGSMGLHLLNPELLDDEVSVTRPEFLVYEPGPADEMRLVAVEYVISFDERPSDAAPPTLFGHEFHPNATFGVWAFHVWAWRHNPNGIFADWNPLVSCEHAEEVRTFPEE